MDNIYACYPTFWFHQPLPFFYFIMASNDFTLVFMSASDELYPDSGSPNVADDTHNTLSACPLEGEGP